MSAGFTPGPWVIVPNGMHTRLIKSGSALHPVAECGETNARLIAAAPELLTEHEVRASDLFMLKRAIEEGDPKAELLVRVGDMLRETEAIIAKAKGEQA